MEKHYCDYCGEEINGRSYRMLINQLHGSVYEALWRNTDPWQKDFELCKTCAKVIIPKLMENHLCECEEKSRDGACKPSEGHKEEAILVKDIEKWATGDEVFSRKGSILRVLLEEAPRILVETEEK